MDANGHGPNQLPTIHDSSVREDRECPARREYRSALWGCCQVCGHEGIEHLLMHDASSTFPRASPSIAPTFSERLTKQIRRTVELVQQHRRVSRTDDVKDVIRNLQNSPTSAFLRSLSLHERILLAALLRCMRRAGVGEIPCADVSHQDTLYSGVLCLI